MSAALRDLIAALKRATPSQRRMARVVARSQQRESEIANRTQPRILALFHGMRDALSAALPASTKSDPQPDIDALLSNPGFLAHLDALNDLLSDTHGVALQFGYDDMTQEMGRLNASFSLTNPHVAAAVDQLGGKLSGITDTTRDMVRRVISKGVENGSTYQEMAKAIHDSSAFGPNRALTIARTEAGLAYARGAAAAMRDLDVTHVLISDGDDFDEPCKAVDGTIQTIEWYEANPKEHPRCTRAAAPAPEDQ